MAGPEKIQNREKRRWRCGIMLGALIAASLVPIAAFGWKDLYARFLERKPPNIRVTDPVSGIGAVPQDLTLDVSDFDSGLSSIDVYARQGALVFNLDPAITLRGKKRERVTLQLAGAFSDLSPGKLEIGISAKDSSLWRNKEEQSFALQVNFTPPLIRAVFSQAPRSVGGTGIVFFSAISSVELAEVGVEVDGYFFPAFPARLFDQAFANSPLYVALFTVPLSPLLHPRESNGHSVRLVAQDTSGNAVAKDLLIGTVKHDKSRELESVNPEFLRYRVHPLFEKHAHEIMSLAEASQDPLFTSRISLSELNPSQRLHLILDYLLPLSNAKLATAASSQRFERFWYSSFLQPAGQIHGGFGKERTYRFQESEIATISLTGIDIVTRDGATKVKALAKGIVENVGEAGSYGRFVALNHGLGLSTVYAMLGSVSVQKGQVIEYGSPLGTPLTIAGADGDGSYHIKALINGIPVSIEEWLNPEWYSQMILISAVSAKRVLGLPLT